MTAVTFHRTVGAATAEMRARRAEAAVADTERQLTESRKRLEVLNARAARSWLPVLAAPLLISAVSAAATTAAVIAASNAGYIPSLDAAALSDPADRISAILAVGVAYVGFGLATAAVRALRKTTAATAASRVRVDLLRLHHDLQQLRRHGAIINPIGDPTGRERGPAYLYER